MIISVAALAAVQMVGMFTVSNALGVINLAIVTLNVFDAWRSKNFDPGLLFKIGITLFCLGDYAILFRTLLSGGLGSAAKFLVWVFYVPATALIVCNYVKKLKSDMKG